MAKSAQIKKKALVGLKIDGGKTSMDTTVSIGGKKIGYIQSLTYCVDVDSVLPRLILNVYCPNAKIAAKNFEIEGNVKFYKQ